MKCEPLPATARNWWTLWFRPCPDRWEILAIGNKDTLEGMTMNQAFEHLILPPGESPIMKPDKSKWRDSE